MTAELSEKFAAVFKHEQSCGNSKCHELATISHMEKYLTPEQMKTVYGNDIESWKFGLD